MNLRARCDEGLFDEFIFMDSYYYEIVFADESNQDMKTVLQQLEKALKEVNELKAENLAIKKARNLKTDDRDDNRVDKFASKNDEQKYPVLPKPTDTRANSTDLYSKQHEIDRRALDNSIKELFFYLFEQTRKNGNNPEPCLCWLNQPTLAHLTDRAANWHRLELQKLTDTIQQRIHKLQNPVNCKETNILVCDLNKGCGFGCQLHHVGYCLSVAAASNRTLVLDKDGDGWRYSKQGWTSVFKAISSCTFADAVPVGTSTESWKTVNDKARVTFLTIVEALIKKPEQLPLSFPKQLADNLLTHHSYPPVFFGSQFVWYLMRSNKHMQDILSSAEAKIPFNEGPIVGLQIRRTDKIGTEASFHSVEEYFRWAEVWFRVQELRHSPAKTLKRRVFIATDDPGAVKEAKEKYPNYEVFADVGIAQSAQVANRYTDASLYGVITDVRMLSKCDYLVCTFSSQVCRVGYELMQIEKGDAGDWFHSLDDVYYYGGQHAHDQVVVENHVAENSHQMDLKVGDVVGIAGNHWDGFSKGTNRRTGKVGLYPSYKAVEKYRIVDFPIFAQ
ncbi:hypothetical protein M3Y97_00135300 [Aphelenchoides bicaudatus]|nr:hypothetical protein M3Y97_00135300 [Aphelenchoides bicaudatus]